MIAIKKPTVPLTFVTSNSLYSVVLQEANVSDKYKDISGYWGYDFVHSLHAVVNISIKFNGVSSQLRAGGWSDLSTVRTIWLENRAKGTVLVITGGPKGEAYKCWLTLVNGKLVGRTVMATGKDNSGIFEKERYYRWQK